MAELSFPGRVLVSQADLKRQDTSASEEQHVAKLDANVLVSVFYITAHLVEY